MIEMRLDNLHPALLVTFTDEATNANFARLDELFRIFVEQHGTMDTIIDYSSIQGQLLDTHGMIDRARRAARMSRRQRIFVAGNDLVFGMMRLYSAYQEASGEVPPNVLRSLEEALKMLDIPLERFKPISL